MFAILLFITYSVTAQTTQQEYDYVTKELKLDLVKGGAIKTGYFLEEYLKSEIEESNWFISYYLLRKDSVTKPVAIIIVSGPSLSDKSSFFYCIPAYHSDPLIWEQFKLSVANIEEGFIYQSALALSKALTSN